MIIGNGLIASAIKDIAGVTYFASGVSNSSEVRQSEFDREEALLRTVTEPVVYFSTTPKNDSPYMRHKRRMENIVRGFNQHTIVRVQYVCGNGGNSTNLFNYLKRTIQARDFMQIYNANRALLDVDDLARIVPLLGYGTYTIAGIEPLPVVRIAEMIAANYGLSLNYTTVEVEEEQNQNSWYIEEVIKKLGIQKDGYTERVIRKYC